MADGKKGFIVYTSWYKAIALLNDKQAGQLFKWMMKYCNDENPDFPSDSGVAALCATYQDLLKIDLKKYEAKVASITNARNNRKNVNIENNVEINNEINDAPSVDINASNKLLVISNKKEAKASYNNTLSEASVCECAHEEKPKFKKTDFDRFWELYPKKIGKEKCRNWFIAHKPKPELVDKMLETIKKFLDTDWNCESRFIPHPYTWLNRGGWDDQPTTAAHEMDASAKAHIVWEEA